MDRNFQSICPVCGIPIPASYVTQGTAVYVEKYCEEHGNFKTLASENAADFDRWMDFVSVTVPPLVYTTTGVRSFFSGNNGHSTDAVLNTECPYHCGLCENHLMTSCCVLINVTDRCNQHCPYCFAVAELSEAGEPSLGDPPLAEIDFWLDRLIDLGEDRKFNIQLSGGEPTVRNDLPEIISLCVSKGFEYIQLNTNGKRLAGSSDGIDGLAYAKYLKDAGLSTVFLQFDGLTDDIHVAMRGESLMELKQRAIDHCGKAGLPVTLVPTVTKEVNLDQVGALVRYMLDHVNVIKGIHFQPASFFGRNPDEPGATGDFNERVTMFAVMDEMERQTYGLIKKADLAPISTGHPLCCFSAAFMKNGDKVKKLNSGGSCCDSDDPLETIRRDRDFVLNKWAGTAPEADSSCCCEPSPVESETCCCEPAPAESSGAMGFDEAIAHFKANMFTLSGMAFMDRANLDSERLRRCRVQVFADGERLVPFCGYYSVNPGSDHD